MITQAAQHQHAGLLLGMAWASHPTLQQLRRACTPGAGCAHRSRRRTLVRHPTVGAWHRGDGLAAPGPVHPRGGIRSPRQSCAL